VWRNREESVRVAWRSTEPWAWLVSMSVFPNISGIYLQLFSVFCVPCTLLSPPRHFSLVSTFLFWSSKIIIL
jgi:hypothetical protein